MSATPKEPEKVEPPKEKKRTFSSATGDKVRAEHRRVGLIGTLVAGALGGGAFLSRRGSEGFLPEETRRALDATEDTYNRILTSRTLSGTDATDDAALKAYFTHASRLANAPVAGMKGHELIKMLRQRLPIREKWLPHLSDAHYNAFARGPAYGAAQFLDETAERIGRKSYKVKDKGLKRYMAEKFTPEFSKKLNETSAAHEASPMDVGPSLRESLGYNGKTIADHKQPAIMEEIISGDRFNKKSGPFVKGFSDHYGELKKQLAAEVMNKSFPGYLGISRKVRRVYGAMNTAIPALLGAAGIGVAGYGGFKLLKSLQRTAYEKRMMEKSEREGEDEEEKSASIGNMLNNVLNFAPKLSRISGYTLAPEKINTIDQDLDLILNSSSKIPKIKDVEWLDKTLKTFEQTLYSRTKPSENVASLAKNASVISVLRRARNVTHTHPTKAQAHAGNYRKGAFKWNGLTIRIENPEGSTRRGTSKDEKEWSTVMKGDYGYFAGSKGKDGDAVDVFIGPDLESDTVAVIEQTIDGKFDEHKVVIGVKDEEAAKKLYLSNYQKGWKCGPITMTTATGLKTWLASANTKKEFAKAASGGSQTEMNLLTAALMGDPTGLTAAMHGYQHGGKDQAWRSGTTSSAGGIGGGLLGAVISLLTKRKISPGVSAITGSLFGSSGGSVYAANEFNKNLRRQKSAAAEDDEPKMIGKGLGTLFSDYFPYAPSGARRAGAATLMAKRIGEDPGVLLKYPMMSQVLAMLGGGTAAATFHGSTGRGTAASTTALTMLPWITVQALKRHRIRELDRAYKVLDRKRLREVGSDGMVDDAMGSHRLGMAQANDAMRNRKMKDLGSISEAADALPVATSLMGLGPGMSLPLTQLIDHLESRRFINKQADFSDQINGATIPAYLTAAGLGMGGLIMAGKKLHKDLHDPRVKNMPREEWDGLNKHISGRDLLSAEVPGLNNAFFARAKSDEEARGLLTYYALHDPKVRRKLLSNPTGSKLIKQIKEHGITAFDPAFGKASIVGHEAGHGKIEHTPGLLQSLQRNLYQYSPLIAPLSAVGGMAAGLATKNTLGGLLAGTGIGLVGGAGMMFPEYMATHHGMEGLKSYKGGKFAQKGDWGRMLTALGTYGSLNVLPAAASGALGGYIGGRRKKRREQAEANLREPDNVIRMDEDARKLKKTANLAQRFQQIQKLKIQAKALGSDYADKSALKQLGSYLKPSINQFFNNKEVQALGIKKGMKPTKILDILRNVDGPQA